MSTIHNRNWGQALGLASCPFSVLISSCIFYKLISSTAFWLLFLISALWLALEIFIGVTRPFSFKTPSPRWVAVTRGLWLFGPWVSWLDRLHNVTSFKVEPGTQISILLVAFCGLMLRAGAVAELGKFFTYGIDAPEAMLLRTSGLYRWVRHPSFTGLLLLTNMLGFALGSVAGILLLGLTIPNVILRISQEEDELGRRFGEEYQNYKYRSYRLIPFLY